MNCIVVGKPVVPGEVKSANQKPSTKVTLKNINQAKLITTRKDTHTHKRKGNITALNTKQAVTGQTPTQSQNCGNTR